MSKNIKDVIKNLISEEEGRMLGRRHPFMVQLSIEEKSLLSAKAHDARLSLSAFIREAALEKASAK